MVTPTDQLTKRKLGEDRISASSLQLNTHFSTAKIEETALPQEQRESLYENLVTQMTEAGDTLRNNKQVYSIVSECTSKVSQKYARCRGIYNETELRYVVSDPIMEMLCDTYNLHVRLEETVKANLEHDPDQASTSQATPPRTRKRTYGSVSDTPGTSVSKSVSLGSRADYTCYMLRGSNHKVAVMLIEAKMTYHSKFQHAVAQLIGYYIAFNTDETIPPLLFVLSERDVQLVLLPFKDSE